MRFLSSSGASDISIPSMNTSPEVAPIQPQSIRIVVDFPAPFGPRKPTIPPFSTEKVTLFMALKSP